ncbi:hypothetical protein, partial [Vibrio cholerae]|uniref:hypothetical protein n=1 Tax=Vibrio cholerae TaxID=666 RepID=UPI001F393362
FYGRAFSRILAKVFASYRRRLFFTGLQMMFCFHPWELVCVVSIYTPMICGIIPSFIFLLR